MWQKPVMWHALTAERNINLKTAKQSVITTNLLGWKAQFQSIKPAL